MVHFLVFFEISVDSFTLKLFNIFRIKKYTLLNIWYPENLINILFNTNDFVSIIWFAEIILVYCFTCINEARWKGKKSSWLFGMVLLHFQSWYLARHSVYIYLLNRLARYKCRKVGFESSQMLQHFGGGWKRSNKFTGTSTQISSLKLHRQMQFPGANVNSFVCSQLRHSSNKLVTSPCYRRSSDRYVKRERKWFMTRD